MGPKRGGRLTGSDLSAALLAALLCMPLAVQAADQHVPCAFPPADVVAAGAVSPAEPNAAAAFAAGSRFAGVFDGGADAACVAEGSAAASMHLQTALGAAVSPVPEPPSYALMLVGCAVIAIVLRRRRPPGDE